MFLKNAYLGSNKWYLFLITLLLVVAGTIVGQLPLFFIVQAKAIQLGIDQTTLAKILETMDLSPLGLDQNLTIFLMLLSFIGGLAGLWVGVRFVHQKPFVAIISGAMKVSWRKIFFSFALWMALTMVVELVFYLIDPGVYSFQFEPRKFFVLLLIALFLFPLQTSFEELLFRGYLMQAFSLVGRYKWIPLLLTSVGFGLMHFMNPEVQAFGLGLSMTYYIGVGLFLGILTLMDDGLELALGVHAATNIYSALFVTFDESAVQTAALFHTSEVNMGWMLTGFVVAAVVFYAIVSKKYLWGPLSGGLGKIEKPQSLVAGVIDDEDL